MQYLGMTANKLAKIASELESENAKLRASNEVIAEDHAALCEQNAKLQETLQRRNEQLDVTIEMWVDRGFENAKLRELISNMWNDAVTRMNGVNRHEFIDKFLDHLRDLEVEV